MAMLFLGAIFLILFTDLKAISPTSKKITVTFHKYKKSWNQAQDICERLGGNLYTEDSPEKAAVLAKYRNEKVWIGLHSLDIGGSYTWVYGKPSCQAIVPSVHSNWESGQSLKKETKRCALYRLKDGKWKVENCQQSDKKFLCERQEDTSCTFTEIPGSPKSSLSNHYDTQGYIFPDNTTCRNACLSTVRNDLNCWMATYRSTACVLYYTTDPFLFSANIDSSSGQLFIKDCYTNATDTTDDTAITTETSAEPKMGCSATTTPSTTISSTTISSTTPSSTTSSILSATSVRLNSTSSSSDTDTTDDTTITTGKNDDLAMGGSDVTTFTSSTTTTSSTTVSSTTISSTTPSSTSSSIPSATSVGLNSTSSSSSVTNSLSTSTSSTGISSSSAITISPGSSEMSVSSTSVAPTSGVSTVSQTTSNCTCLCNDLKTLYRRNVSINPEFANLTSEEILEKIIEKLRVNKSTLSAIIRKKTSATDNRPSSVLAGVIAVVFIATVFGLLVAGDGVQLATYVRQKIASSISGT